MIDKSIFNAIFVATLSSCIERQLSYPDCFGETSSLETFPVSAPWQFDVLSIPVSSLTNLK
jgi:hypothetical protein